MNKLIKAIKNPNLVLLYLMQSKPFRLLSDEHFIKLEYYLKLGEKLNLDQPQTFNEKLQWLKLNDKNELYTQLVDKFEARSFVEETIGEKYLIPLYGVYDSFEEINFDDLPNQFVLKPTHTSGNYYICQDKTKIDYVELKKEVNDWLNREYFWVHREWPYKNVKPRLIVEKYLVDDEGKGLSDFKFFCFHGEVKFLHISSNREVETYIDYFDVDFNHIELRKEGIKNSPNKLKKPHKFEEMVKLAEVLSDDFPFVRVDFYNLEDNVYFGELTFYPASGYNLFIPKYFDTSFGELLELPTDEINLKYY